MAADRKLREAERLEPGSARALTEQRRAGLLSDKRLGLLVYCGYEPARQVLERPTCGRCLGARILVNHAISNQQKLPDDMVDGKGRPFDWEACPNDCPDCKGSNRVDHPEPTEDVAAWTQQASYWGRDPVLRAYIGVCWAVLRMQFDHLVKLEDQSDTRHFIPSAWDTLNEEGRTKFLEKILLTDARQALLQAEEYLACPCEDHRQVCFWAYTNWGRDPARPVLLFHGANWLAMNMGKQTRGVENEARWLSSCVRGIASALEDWPCNDAALKSARERVIDWALKEPCTKEEFND